MDVLNGTDTSGVARRNATALQRLGFKVNTIDSTAATARTTVEYPDGAESAAKALLAAVPGSVPLATPDVSRVTLVVGANGVMAGGLAPARSSGAATAPAPRPAANGLGCID